LRIEVDREHALGAEPQRAEAVQARTRADIEERLSLSASAPSSEISLASDSRILGSSISAEKSSQFSPNSKRASLVMRAATKARQTQFRQGNAQTVAQHPMSDCC
jgi:hypothetical protein